jgi:hypothetical protein
MDDFFDTYISDRFAELGIARLIDALQDPAAFTVGDPALLDSYADMATQMWLGPPLVLQDGRDGAQVLAGLLRAGLIEALVVGPEEPDWIRHLEWMWSVCASESMARRFVALLAKVRPSPDRPEVGDPWAAGLSALAAPEDLFFAV